MIQLRERSLRSHQTKNKKDYLRIGFTKDRMRRFLCVNINSDCGKTCQSAIIGLAVSAVCSCIFSALIFFVLKDMGLTSALSAAAVAVGSYTGSYICGRYRRRRGAICGLICGAVMFAVLFFAGLALSAETAGIKKLLLLIVSGCAGGVCGVNTKRPGSLM